MAILVIGGAGYIGSVTVSQLTEAGEDVVVLDNLSRGHRAAVVSGPKLVVGDMADRELLADLLREREIEAVLHFAAHSLVGESMEKPLLYWENNVQAGVTLLRAMAEAGVKRIIFSSTAAVYGEPAEVPITENCPIKPTNTYGVTKWTFEQLLADADRAHGIRSVRLRYFNAAGCTERCGEDHTPETHLIPVILQVALGQRKGVSIYGEDYPTRDGTCVRDYIHVSDLARAHLLALGHLRAGGKSTAFNLGNGEGFTVREIIEIARETTGHPIPAAVGPRRAGDPATLIASSARIAKVLGWKPECSDIRSIIQSAWAWHREHPQGYSDGQADR
jgi:UDP-glucose 4-epimerase